MNDSLLQVSIKIFDKDYLITCQPSQQDDLRASAQLLDQRMRDIHRHGRVTATDRIAVMAALNIAHDLIQMQRVRTTLDDESVRRLQTLQYNVIQALSVAELKSISVPVAAPAALDAPDERV